MLPEIPPHARAVIHGEPFAHPCLRPGATGPDRARPATWPRCIFDLPGGRRVSPLALAPLEPSEIDPANPPPPPFSRCSEEISLCLPFAEPISLSDHSRSNLRTKCGRSRERSEDRLVTALEMREPQARVEKIIQLNRDHRAVYQEHRISGLSGRFSYGHHAILEFPETGRRSLFFQYKPHPLRRHQAAPLTTIRLAANTAHCHPAELFATAPEYPRCHRRDDRPHTIPGPRGLRRSRHGEQPQGAPLPGVRRRSMAMFGLRSKIPRDFPSTLFWLTMADATRDPWNGRHKRRLGLEGDPEPLQRVVSPPRAANHPRQARDSLHARV